MNYHMLNVRMLHEHCFTVKEEQNTVLALRKLTAYQGDSNDNDLLSSYYMSFIVLNALLYE